MSRVFLEQSLFTLCFEEVSHRTWNSLIQLCWPLSPGIFLCLPPQHWDYYRHALQRPAFLLFNVDDKDPNSGP